jgi:hypothetical protein
VTRTRFLRPVPTITARTVRAAVFPVTGSVAVTFSPTRTPPIGRREPSAITTAVPGTKLLRQPRRNGTLRAPKKIPPVAKSLPLPSPHRPSAKSPRTSSAVWTVPSTLPATMPTQDSASPSTAHLAFWTY